MLYFQDQHLKKYKAQKIVEFNFLKSFQLIFLKFCPQNLLQFEDVPIKCSKHYVEFIYKRVCEKKFEKNSEFHVLGWFPGLQNLDAFLENVLWSKFSNRFQAEIIPQSLLFLDFVIVFYMIWKNEKSRELSLDGFWGNRHSKMSKISAQKNFFSPF